MLKKRKGEKKMKKSEELRKKAEEVENLENILQRIEKEMIWETMTEIFPDEEDGLIDNPQVVTWYDEEEQKSYMVYDWKKDEYFAYMKVIDSVVKLISKV